METVSSARGRWRLDNAGSFSSKASCSRLSLISCVVLRLIADIRIFPLKRPECLTVEMTDPVVIVVHLCSNVHQVHAVDVDPGQDINIALVVHALDLGDDGLPELLTGRYLPLNVQLHVCEPDRVGGEARAGWRCLDTVGRIVDGMKIGHRPPEVFDLALPH